MTDDRVAELRELDDQVQQQLEGAVRSFRVTPAAAGRVLRRRGRR